MADYWVRNLGGTNKAAAVDEAHGMNVATFNASTFSENDRIFFSHIDGNITSKVVPPSGGITLLSGQNQPVRTLIHCGGTIDEGIRNAGKSGVEIDGIDVTLPTVSGIVTIGDVVDCIIRNVDSGYSGNQAFQNEGGSGTIIYYDVVGHHCTDDGFSAHDTMTCTVYRGDFYSNGQGVNNIGNSLITCYDCNVWDTLQTGKAICPDGNSGSYSPEIKFIRGSITSKAGIGILMQPLYGILVLDGTEITGGTGCTRLLSSNHSNVIIRNSLLLGNGCTDHLIMTATGDTILVHHNIIGGALAAKAHIFTQTGTTNNGIHNNLFLPSAGGGVATQVSADVANNIFNDLAYPIWQLAGTTTSRNNCNYSCNAPTTPPTTQTGIITGDPLLNADYTLQAASPCIGAGVVVSGLTTDRSGRPTPGPCGTSIGPHEYMSDMPEGYGMRALFDGTIPAWAIPAGVQFARYNKIVNATTISRTFPV